MAVAFALAIEDPMRSFSEHCAYLGCPLRNPRWSWSAVSSNGMRTLFTLWDDEVKGRRTILYPVAARRPGPVGEAADLKAGGREVRELALRAANTSGVEAYGVLCRAKDPDAVPRQRVYFDEETVFRLKVWVDEEEIVWAELVARIPCTDLHSRRV